MLLLGVVLNVWSLARWRGTATLREPLLAILHVGYAWMVIGAGLLGGSLLTVAIPASAAIHALMAGLVGTMVVAVMTRVARGHSGRPLEADLITALVYVINVLAGVTRVAAAFVDITPQGFAQHFDSVKGSKFPHTCVEIQADVGFAAVR